MRRVYIGVFALFTIISCNQSTLTAAYGVKSVVTAPLSLLKEGYNLVTGNTYGNLEEKSAEEKSNKSHITISCKEMLAA